MVNTAAKISSGCITYHTKPIGVFVEMILFERHREYVGVQFCRLCISGSHYYEWQSSESSEPIAARATTREDE